MRVKGTGVGYPRNSFVPEGTGSEHRQPVKEGGYSENCCYQTPHGNLLRPRRARRGGGGRNRPKKFPRLLGGKLRPARAPVWAGFFSLQARQDTGNKRLPAGLPVACPARAAF